MSEGRNYTSGTKEALFMLSRGFCYRPECRERVMRFTDSGWRIKAIVAHIHGLNPGSARYDERIPVPERNSFRNLILVCKKDSDIIDGPATRDSYPPETLIGWKRDREGDLADELDVLDWITQERLEEMMAEAIVATEEKILGAIGRVEGIGKETLVYLKRAVRRSLIIPYLDPKSVASLEQSAIILKEIPEYAPMLAESSRNLIELSDSTFMLHSTTRSLRDLELIDSAELLQRAANSFENIGLDDLPDTAELLLQVVTSFKDMRLSDLQYRVNEIESASRDLLAASESLEVTSKRIMVADGSPPRPVATKTTAQSQQKPWNWYWSGVMTCAVFVILILSLWAYATHHK